MSIVHDGQSRRLSPSGRAWLAALLGWSLLISTWNLGGAAGLQPVEAWVTQTAREMNEDIATMRERAATEGWSWRPIVIPSFGGEARLQKSPGAYYAVMLTAWLRGTHVDEVAGRIPNAIFAVMMTLVVFWLTLRIAGERSAVFAGFASASCGMLLHWSHSASSDLGVATWMTLSLASLWIGSETATGGKRVALWMLGYFAAGMGMLYKMPLPLVCIGAPAVLYVVLRNRWRIFASWWHIVGLLVFLLPWLPWLLATLQLEELAPLKWRVEYWDRLTGALPTVEAQRENAIFYLMPLGAALLLCAPFTLSVPGAVVRGVRHVFSRGDYDDAHRNGVAFCLIWFLSLLAFFSAATGKETRYFLPMVPPLLVLLGMELAYFFDPRRQGSDALRTIAIVIVAIAVPTVLAVLGMKWWKMRGPYMPASLDEALPPFIGMVALFTIGTTVSAVLFRSNKAHASFGALVVAMWATYAFAWTYVLPFPLSQAPYTNFAQQLASLTPDQQSRLRQVAQQDPRHLWYSKVRYKRLIDQLDFLEEQNGLRDPRYERRRMGEEMVKWLESPDLALLVMAPLDYVEFQAFAPIELARAGRDMPPMHIWLQARYGDPTQRYVVVGNQRPAWPEPELPEQLQRFLAKARERANAISESPPAVEQQREPDSERAPQ
ncbi:MAG: glycosyltransferase family 39 protein [Phycisphaerales bacterium]|nr:glycosyltransferase family 39 protein [Phycisphaerales bacterium]